MFLPCTCWRGAHTRLAVWPVCGYLYTSVVTRAVCQTSRVRISGPRVPVVRTLFPATLLLCQPITAPILNTTVECVQETSIGPKILECRLDCSHFSIVCTVLSYQMFVYKDHRCPIICTSACCLTQSITSNFM